jgi:thioredoxin 1
VKKSGSASANGLYSSRSENYHVRTRKMRSMSDKPGHLTDANFEETIKNNSLVLVDFWAGWCGPCRALAPTIEELAREYAGKVLVAKLDVDENPTTAEKFQVYSIPTVVILKDCCEAERIVGLCSKDKYEAALEKILPRPEKR